MKKNLKKMIIATVATMVMMMAAAPVNATEESQVGYVDITKHGAAVEKVTTKVDSSTKIGYRYTSLDGKIYKTTNWKSTNTKIATVKKNSDGTATIKAKKAGTVKISVELEGKKDTCTVTVKSAWVSTTDCYSQLNKYRKAAGKKALKKDKKLEKIAKIRAEEMAKTGKFSHTRPNGKSGLTLIKGNLYKGENIAMGQRTCKEVSTAWYNSKGHKKNMLKKQYKKVGIAAFEYNGVIYWAQVFSS